MTVVYKNSAPGLQTGLEVIVANDERTKRLLFHQRAKSKNGRKCVFPLEIFTENSSIEIRHDLIDAEISICSPSVLSLFADNFDFQSRDDFIRGLLINEEILASTIYVSELPSEQYATKVKDWQMYRIARWVWIAANDNKTLCPFFYYDFLIIFSHDIINRWAYPLVPDMGICCLKQNYMFLRNNVYRNGTVRMANNVKLRENVVIHQGCFVDEGTEISNSVVGRNCRIGRECILQNAFVFDGVEIGDKCVLKNCVIGKRSKIFNGTKLLDGTIVGGSCEIPKETNLNRAFIVAQHRNDELDEGRQRHSYIHAFWHFSWAVSAIFAFAATYTPVGKNAYIMHINDGMNERIRITGTAATPVTVAETMTTAADSDGEESVGIEWDNLYMTDVAYKYESSIYSSSSEEMESHRLSPVPDDANSWVLILPV